MNTETLTPCQQQQGVYNGDVVIIKNHWATNNNALGILKRDDRTRSPFFYVLNHGESIAELVHKTVKLKDYFDDIFNITPVELALLELAHPELIGFDWNSELLALIAYCNENNVLINL